MISYDTTASTPAGMPLIKVHSTSFFQKEERRHQEGRPFAGDLEAIGLGGLSPIPPAHKDQEPVASALVLFALPVRERKSSDTEFMQ